MMLITLLISLLVAALIHSLETWRLWVEKQTIRMALIALETRIQYIRAKDLRQRVRKFNLLLLGISENIHRMGESFDRGSVAAQNLGRAFKKVKQ